MLENISSRVLIKAAQLKERIEGLSHELRQLLEGGGVSVEISIGKSSGKRVISAAGKARIAAAQRARWAKAKSAANDGEAAAKPGKRTMSAEGRARIAAAARRRWAKAKKAGKNSL